MSEPINPLFTFPKKRNYVETNQNQPMADGTKVAAVRPRRNGNEDFMMMLAKAFQQAFSGQGQETNEQKLKALRNDPIGDANKADYLKRTTVDNQGGMGPMTRASGMTPEQVARMQGPTAANQWKFPDLFKAPRVMPDAQRGGGWQMPDVGLKQSIFDGTAPFQTPKLSPQGQSPMEGFNPETAPAPSPMFEFNPETAPAPSPMSPFDPEQAPAPSPMFGFNPETAPAPEFTYDQDGYKIDKKGQKYGRNGRPTYGPQAESIYRFFGLTK